MNENSTKLRKKMVETISNYKLIDEGDRVMVAVSGGKDSTIMLLLLDEIRKRAPFKFTLHPVLLDQRQPGFSVGAYKAWLYGRGFDLDVITEDTYSIVKTKTKPGKSFCGLCSRLRRGVLYNHAFENKFDKIALGHHRDDLNQTLLMNLFFNGMISSMPPKLTSDDQRNVVIRPLATCAESQIAELADSLAIPTIPCNLCGNQENLQRQRIKQLLKDFSRTHIDVHNSIAAAHSNIKPSQLSDKDFW